ncbi:MAG: hypothetical protein J7M25_00565 [Deltaproteobacteria bacterium]|nr:hypothetical protein [Deltaproteobacteria bacterium]
MHEMNEAGSPPSAKAEDANEKRRPGIGAGRISWWPKRTDAPMDRFVPLLHYMVIGAVVEFLLHRLLTGALEPGMLQDPSPAYQVAVTYSPIFYHWTNILGLTCLAAALYKALRSDALASGWKAMVGLIGGSFLPIAIIAVMVASPHELIRFQGVRPLLPYLTGVYIVSIAAALVVLWQAPGTWVRRIATTLLVIPLGLLALYQEHRLGLEPAKNVHLVELVNTSRWPLSWAAVATKYAGLWLPLFFATGTHSGRESLSNLPGILKARLYAVGRLLSSPIPLAIGLTAVAGLAVWTKLDFHTATRAWQESTGLDLAAPSALGVLFLLSLMVFVALVVDLALRNTADRLTAAGLVLWFLAGYRLADPLPYLLSLGSIVALTNAMVRETTQSQTRRLGVLAVPSNRWKPLLQSFQEQLRAVGLRDLHAGTAPVGPVRVSSLFGRWHAINLDARFGIRRNRIEFVEISIGEIPSGKPDCELMRKNGRSTSMRPEGSEQHGDILVTDRGKVSQKLLSDEVMEQAQTLLVGRIAFWWGIGLRWRVDHGRMSAGDHERLARLLGLLPGDESAEPTNFKRLASFLGLLAKRANIVNDDTPLQ